MSKKLLTIRQTAKELDISPDTLRRWDKAGKFRSTRHPMNNYRMYSAKAIEKLKNELYVINIDNNLKK